MSLKSGPMYYTEDKEPKEPADKTEDRQLVLDGTASLDYSEDEVPRVKGLIELLRDYFGPENTGKPGS